MLYPPTRGQRILLVCLRLSGIPTRFTFLFAGSSGPSGWPIGNLYRWTGGRFGLWTAKPGRWGTMCLTTVGRRTGRSREVIVGCFEDGDNLVTMAMNGWGRAESAWWLNVQAHPDVTVNLVAGTRQVTGRETHGAERDRLWSRWRQIDKNLDSYAARRPMQTAVVVFEPRRQQ